MKNLLISIIESQKKIPIIFESPLWERIVKFISENFGSHSKFIITDDHIYNIYEEKINHFVSHLNNFRKILLIPAGENSKSRSEKNRLEDEILAHQGGRDSLLLVLGGGVVGDLGGFVAATLHRGVPFIQIPTTVLAQVDSSIGGKVGINHPRGKNLIGAFYHPQAIFIDVAFLETLSEEEYANGLAEVIKYAVTLDAELWRILEEKSAAILERRIDVLNEIIFRSVQAKVQVVEKDEKETAYRSILNFGHTVGHAIENLSHFNVKHGFAIAAGMRIAAHLSQKLLGYPNEAVVRLDNLLNIYNLNGVDISRWSSEQIWNSMKLDKKARGTQPLFTLLDKDGKPKLFHPVSKTEFFHVIESIA